METRGIMSFPGKNRDVLLPGEQPEIEKNPLDDIFGKLNRVDEKAWWPMRDVLLGNAEEKNPLGSLDSLLNGKTTIGASNGNSIMNTYPFGKKSDIFQNLFAVCRGERTLEEVLAYIDEWCEKSGKKFGLGEDKHVLLLTDKWDDAVFDKYRDKFRRRAMHEDFWFFFLMATDTKWVDISPFPVELYDFTRHKKGQQKTDNVPKKFPSNDSCCVLCGSYRHGSDSKAEVRDAVAIGRWEDKRKVFTAIDVKVLPKTTGSAHDARVAVNKVAVNCKQPFQKQDVKSTEHFEYTFEGLADVLYMSDVNESKKLKHGIFTIIEGKFDEVCKAYLEYLPKSEKSSSN